MPALGNVNCNKQPPKTGLIAPADMKVIQLEATNACPKRCSNCTRFVSHQRKPFLADREQWRRMVESMRGFGGMVGFMGGEPTIHPDFDWMVRLYRERIGNGHLYPVPTQPIADFSSYYQAKLTSINHTRGLWTSLGPGYYKHYTLIQETFPYQCVNDHSHAGLHQALLVTYKDLGISREEFEAKRDNCWVQRLWSASATPWGTYFCEVAAAIDHLFYQGANAWPLEPGWWRRKPAEFGAQLKLCDHCSACLDVPRRPATDEIDDVSPSNYQQLVKLDSPAIKRDAVQVIATEGYQAEQFPCNPNPSWYMEQPEGEKQENLRVGPTNRSVYPKTLDCLVVCVGRSEHLAAVLPFNRRQFDRVVVVTSSRDPATCRVAEANNAEVLICEDWWSDTEAFNKGKMFNAGLEALAGRDWILATDSDILQAPTLREQILGHVLNPDCLYYTTRYRLPTLGHVELVKQDWEQITSFDVHLFHDQEPWGYFQLFNLRARVLCDKLPRPCPEWFPTAGGVDHQFSRLWGEHEPHPGPRLVRLDQSWPGVVTGHVEHGTLSAAWVGPEATPRQWRFIGFVHGCRRIEVVRSPLKKHGQYRLLALNQAVDRVFAGGDPQLMIQREARTAHNRGCREQLEILWRPEVC